MWYRKRNDATAKYVADQCGLTSDLAMVGSVLHQDDLENLRVQLFKVTKDTMFQLFEETKLGS